MAKWDQARELGVMGVPGVVGPVLAANVHPTLSGQPEAAQAPSPGIGHLPGEGDGLRPGQDVSLWVAAAQQGAWLAPWL